MNENARLRQAFEAIRAEEGLKSRTAEFVTARMERERRHRNSTGRRLALAAACVVILCILGGWTYLTPTATISIDINPSIELGVNRFDRVVSVTGRNDDGQMLAAELDLRFMDYHGAVEAVLEAEPVAELLSEDGLLSIGVIGPDGEQCQRMLSAMEACAAQHEHALCYRGGVEEAAAAREVGLSVGKYRAFLELQALDPDVTPEEVGAMSMREIRERIQAETDGGGAADSGTCGGAGHHGYGYGRR